MTTSRRPPRIQEACRSQMLVLIVSGALAVLGLASCSGVLNRGYQLEREIEDPLFGVFVPKKVTYLVQSDPIFPKVDRHGVFMATDRSTQQVLLWHGKRKLNHVGEKGFGDSKLCKPLNVVSDERRNLTVQDTCDGYKLKTLDPRGGFLYVREVPFLLGAWEHLRDDTILCSKPIKTDGLFLLHKMNKQNEIVKSGYFVPENMEFLVYQYSNQVAFDLFHDLIYAVGPAFRTVRVFNQELELLDEFHLSAKPDDALEEFMEQGPLDARTHRFELKQRLNRIYRPFSIHVNAQWIVVSYVRPMEFDKEQRYHLDFYDSASFALVASFPTRFKMAGWDNKDNLYFLESKFVPGESELSTNKDRIALMKGRLRIGDN